jgi:hypothetical protein
MPPPTLELADIFRRHGPAYRQTHDLPLHQHRLMRAIENCHTPASRVIAGRILSRGFHPPGSHRSHRSLQQNLLPRPTDCRGFYRQPTGINLRLCPQCGKGILIRLALPGPLPSVMNTS